MKGWLNNLNEWNYFKKSSCRKISESNINIYGLEKCFFGYFVLYFRSFYDVGRSWFLCEGIDIGIKIRSIIGDGIKFL